MLKTAECLCSYSCSYFHMTNISVFVNNQFNKANGKMAFLRFFLWKHQKNPPLIFSNRLVGCSDRGEGLLDWRRGGGGLSEHRTHVFPVPISTTKPSPSPTNQRSPQTTPHGRSSAPPSIGGAARSSVRGKSPRVGEY